ncbi:MAG TPA: TonB-dependent receptor [Acidobacteriaceae bacterium]|nr:TonB-dependent receptor [Acidobacteriaceae bacterium]
MTHASRPARRFLIFLGWLGFAATSYAVSVHGTVTDPLGVPIANATVALVQDGNVIRVGRTGFDGGYTLVSSQSGRFYVLASGHSFRQLQTQSFYGRQLDDVEQNIVLEPEWVRQSVVVTPTGVPQPQAQTTGSVTGIGSLQYENRADIVDALRQIPGLTVVQQGQHGGVTSVFVRGGNSTANRVVLDGVPVEDVGGRFDFGNVATMGLESVEAYRGPNSVLYGSDASAGVVALTTPRGSTQFPSLLYQGEAGGFGSYKNQVQLGGMRRKLDYYGGFSAFQSGNAIPWDEYHDDTSVANVGWSWSANTEIRVTAHNSDSATGLPGANGGYSFDLTPNDGKELDQDSYGSGTISHTFRDNLHAYVRYGLVRKREESQQWFPAGYLLTGPYFGAGNYYGHDVTVRGANGYSVSGRTLMNYSPADFGVYPNDLALDSNRDDLFAQMNYVHGPHLAVVAGFRYEDERGLEGEQAYGIHQTLERENYDYQAQVGGQFKSRLFYTAAGNVEKNGLFGTVGTPRVGASYYLVRPGRGFRGTKLNFNFARGYQEPTLDEQFGSLYTFMANNGGLASAQQYGITPIGAQQSRTYDGGFEQSLFSEKIAVRGTYFHNEFGNQTEDVPAAALPALLPNLSASQLQSFEAFLNNSGAYELDLNSQSYRAQGAEGEVNYGVGKNLFLRAGYTYLQAAVQRSFSSDNFVCPANSPVTCYSPGPSYNPNFPTIPIGDYSPLVAARPFRRPPHTAFADAIYTGKKWTGVVDMAYASPSDDSTYLGGDDVNFGNTLLMPNRNLDYGYTKVDLGASYQYKPWMAIYTQIDNLTSSQHIGPIGYPSLPLNYRTGLRFTLSLGKKQ